MLALTPRNISYIRALLNRGYTADTISVRIEERLIWDGPFPTEMDIRRYIRTSATPDAGKGEPHRLASAGGSPTSNNQDRSTP